VNTKTVNETLITLFLKRKTMIRGVSWALASCTARRSAEETKMMKVNIAEAMVTMTILATSGSTLNSQPVARSMR
jgi:hypothetical protein